MSEDTALALLEVKNLSQDDIHDWKIVSESAIHHGIAEKIESYTALVQAMDNVAYHMFMYSIVLSSAVETEIFNEVCDTLSYITHIASVGSGVHPTLINAYILCMMDTRLDMLTHMLSMR